MSVLTGLDVLLRSLEAQGLVKGKVGYLCHGASVDCSLRHGVYGLQRVFGKRLAKVFSPQHGFSGDQQDDMIESEDFVHPYFKLVVHSLYSETRVPTAEMLGGLDTVLVDLQDVGTRIYTYIYTMTLLMEACGARGIRVVVLDRPNPIGGETMEGPVLQPAYTSFVGRHPLPVRHGLTIGEVAVMAKRCFGAECELEVIRMAGWKRSQFFEETGLPWVLPSPNLATVDAAFVFVGSVIYEGTNLSEGRGTTRSLEIVGHPALEPFGLLARLEEVFERAGLSGFVLRPLYFKPTFQKHADQVCGGYQVHVTDRRRFRPWRVGQLMLRELYDSLGEAFAWKPPPYEYEYDRRPIDLINGNSELRAWVERGGAASELDVMEAGSLPEFVARRGECLLY